MRAPWRQGRSFPSLWCCRRSIPAPHRSFPAPWPCYRSARPPFSLPSSPLSAACPLCPQRRPCPTPCPAALAVSVPVSVARAWPAGRAGCGGCCCWAGAAARPPPPAPPVPRGWVEAAGTAPSGECGSGEGGRLLPVRRGLTAVLLLLQGARVSGWPGARRRRTAAGAARPGAALLRAGGGHLGEEQLRGRWGPGERGIPLTVSALRRALWARCCCSCSGRSPGSARCRTPGHSQGFPGVPRCPPGPQVSAVAREGAGWGSRVC